MHYVPVYLIRIVCLRSERYPNMNFLYMKARPHHKKRYSGDSRRIQCRGAACRLTALMQRIPTTWGTTISCPYAKSNLPLASSKLVGLTEMPRKYFEDQLRGQQSLTGKGESTWQQVASERDRQRLKSLTERKSLAGYRRRGWREKLNNRQTKIWMRVETSLIYKNK